VAQAHPAGAAGAHVEAVPAALEEDDPLLGAGLLAQVEAGVGAVVAGDARVGQVGPLQGAAVIPRAAGRVHHHIVALDHVHAGLPQGILLLDAGRIQDAAAAAHSWQLTKRGQEQER